MKLCAVSVDLDEVPCYHAIHGLAPPDDGSAHAVYTRAVPRLGELFTELGIPATFFVIGRDLGAPIARSAALGLDRAGHELGNHSMNHRYDLVRLGPEAMRAEVRGASDAIAAVVGRRPVGFRAPGYTITDGLFDVLAGEGFAYDSSVFPCPAYYGAKTAAIGLIAARGRASRSIVDRPGVLLAPADPYFPARPYWRRAALGASLVELPIGVTRGARLPFIGTTVSMLGPALAPLLARQMVGRPLVNLELHGLDLLDADDGLRGLAAHQRDLAVPVSRKAAALRATVRSLRDAGYEFVTLRDAAGVFAHRARD
ncbi:MAG: Polysaccharide deacetylase [Myxococcaceae bacterium]|nr:Polysaccharide deacetylase [Myxococcaceae bacterium]